MEPITVAKETAKETAKENSKNLLKDEIKETASKEVTCSEIFNDETILTNKLDQAFNELWKENLNIVNNLNDAFNDVWNDIQKPITYTSDKIKTVDFEAKGFLKNLKEHTFYAPDGKTFQAKIYEVIDFNRTITMPYARFEGKSVNSAGFLRDKDYFSKQYLEKHPETLSEYNKKLIEAGKSPVVDEIWVRYNPLHRPFMGEKLEHHHINNTDKAAYIPQSLHRGRINKDIMHVDNTSLISETYNVIRQNLGEKNVM